MHKRRNGKHIVIGDSAVLTNAVNSSNQLASRIQTKL